MAAAAGDRVGAVTALDVVVAISIGIALAQEQIVAAPAVECVALVITGQRVGIVRALQPLDAVELIAGRIALRTDARRQVGDHT